MTVLRPHRRIHRAIAHGLIASLLGTSSPATLGALTDLADVPLGSGIATTVKPNLLFVLDDSGSMAWTHMPDDREFWTGYVGYRNHLCNTMYYNPAVTYQPPKNADGTSFANASFTAAKTNGYSATASTVDLSTSFYAFTETTSSGNGSDSTQPAYYYAFTRSGTPTTAQCREGADNGFPHGSANFTKVRVGATSGAGGTDERTNFANWFSYYRTRIMMTKAATGRAFSGLGSSYRIGFITINPGSPVSSSRYLAIADFDATQKAAWYSKLYGITPNGGTPLREALARAGRHFAGRQDGINAGMTGDPMQYSCQQNFTLLTTDGYWNDDAGVRLDGTTPIGNTDGTLGGTSPRPIFDGSTATTTTVRRVDTEVYSDNGCRRGRTKILRNVNTTTTTVSDDGTTTTTTSSTQSTPEDCDSNQRALQSPNPRITTTTSAATGGGSSHSLADVAQYYYVTDLRGAGSIGALGLDVGTANNVPATGNGPEDDTASHQHMTTFTMGLGLAGTLTYIPDYRTATTGHFAEIRAGSRNWPVPSAGSATTLDDLWHAAVNGRGQFFSASDPDSVVSSLAAALAGVNARVASAAATATSNPQPTAGDNFAYTASYKTVAWTGELEAQPIDLGTGAVSTTTIWSAQTRLAARVRNFCDNRRIRLFRSGAPDNLTDFTWNTSACDASGNPTGTASTGLDSSEQAHFGATSVAQLNQYSAMTDGSGDSVNQRALAAGAPLVNFIRGQRGHENFSANDAASFFRTREQVLGDIVNAQPVYVKAPFGAYADAGYAAFRTAQANRTPMVYVAANDGMLHAFYAGTSVADTQGGEERWAFIPTMALPHLYLLADTNYGSLHRYFVDGTPTVGDVYDSNAGAWKTVLVGGLNRGGKAYYALDVTDPGNPKGLWEFKHGASCYPAVNTSDCHLGYSYGNPLISKLADGRWVVFVTSGYNNVNAPAVSGDGVGYLYVLDAITGHIIDKISTGHGDATTPSGLGKITNYVTDTATNNTTERVYGVDLQGNLWRFAVNGTRSATLMATARDASGARQSITVKPQIADVGSPPAPFVYVATGRSLGMTDLENTQVQTVYGIKDTLEASPIPDLRASLKNFVITTNGGTRTIACTTSCNSTSGWLVNLPDTGERVTIDMKLELGTLIVGSNVPENSACTVGGYSWVNNIDAATGDKVSGAAQLGARLSASLAVGLSVMRLPDGRVVVIATTSDAKQLTNEVPIAPAAPSGRRISWREVMP